jgi:multiple sugar transport system substrate-binding protein
MKKRTSIIVLLLLLPIALALAGGQQGGAQEKEVTFWNSQTTAHRVKAYDYVFQAFMEENPDVVVKQELVNYGDMFNKTVVGMNTGTLPEFKQSDPTLSIFTWETGALLEVDDLVDQIDSGESYIPSVLIPTYHNDHHWAVPFSCAPNNLFYRPSFFKSAGVSIPKYWDEWLDSAKKLTMDKNGDGTTDQYGIGLVASKTACTDQYYAAFMAAAGGAYFDKSGKVTINTPAVVRALDFYSKLWQYTPPAATGWQWGEIENNWAAGTFAMTPYLNACFRQFYTAKNDDIASTWTPWPKDMKPATTMCIQDFDVHKVAKERGTLEATKKLIEFCMTPENIWVLTNGQEPGHFSPVTQTAIDLVNSGYNNMEVFLVKDFFGPKQQKIYYDHMKVIMSSVEHATNYGFENGPVNLAIGRISNEHVIQDMVQKVVIEGVSPQEAASWAQEKAQKISDEY